MNPQEPQQQNPQAPVEPQYTQPVVAEAPRKNHKKLALWLMIGPSALFVVTIVLYALSNFIFSASQPVDGELYGDTPILKTILNILFFLSGIVTIITWLPGLIIGIILLAKQSK